MSEKTGDKNFQRMAIGLMALTGLGTLLHAIHEMYRDFKPRQERSKAELPARPAAIHEDMQRNHDAAEAESWVQKARVKDRPADAERVWAEAVSRPAQARHH